MKLDEIAADVTAFGHTLASIKSKRTDIRWYPHQSLLNLPTLVSFAGEGREVFARIGPGSRMLDIGAADGDMSFFFADRGIDVTIVDNPSTNYNRCRGLKALQEDLNPNVKFLERDLDFSTEPIGGGGFELAVFMGILYHLRNPMMSLIAVAESAEYLLLSTTVFSRLEAGGPSVEHMELASLAPCRWINNDPTNYWYFTPANLRTMLRRSGWQVLDEFRIGDVGEAAPGHGDERLFCYCRRVGHWDALRLHHDF